MTSLTQRTVALAFATALLAVPALANEPDRSTLSYENNVTINTACFTTLPHGQAQFDNCVAAQLAALKTHPAPDLAALGPTRDRAIRDDCAWRRRDGVVDYNSCLTHDMAETPPSDETADTDVAARDATLAEADAAPQPALKDPADMPRRPAPPVRKLTRD